MVKHNSDTQHETGATAGLPISSRTGKLPVALDSLSQPLERLETLLREMLNEHEALLAAIRRKQQAMHEVRPEMVHEHALEEQQHTQRIAALEEQRGQLVGWITKAADPAAREPLTLRSIADHADQTQRERLLEIRESLRGSMKAIKKGNEVNRRATRDLLAHVQGMLQSVEQARGAAGTYGNHGTVCGSSERSSSFTTTA